MSLEDSFEIVSKSAYDVPIWASIFSYSVMYLIMGPCALVVVLKVLTSDRIFSSSIKVIRNSRLLTRKLVESKYGVFFIWFLWPLQLVSMALDLIYLSGWFGDDVVDLGENIPTRKRRKRRRGFGRLYGS